MDISSFLLHFGYIALTLGAGVVIGYLSHDKIQNGLQVFLKKIRR